MADAIDTLYNGCGWTNITLGIEPAISVLYRLVVGF